MTRGKKLSQGLSLAFFLICPSSEFFLDFSPLVIMAAAAAALPDDVLALVLCQLTLHDFCTAATTCRTWHKAARKKAAWPNAVTGALVFHWKLVCRPLSQTVWAACTRISDVDCCILERVIRELAHVQDLMFVSAHTYSYSPHQRPFIERLVTLRTNDISLVQATSIRRLTSLFVMPLSRNLHQDWMRLLPTLAGLTYVRLETDMEPRSLGHALAQLAHAHRKLRTIHLPSILSYGEDILAGLIHYRHRDLSSIRTLLGVPKSTGILRDILVCMPHLTKYAFEPSHLCDASRIALLPTLQDSLHGLTSLALSAYNDLADSWLIPYLPTLTELSVYTTQYEYKGGCLGAAGPQPNLRLLRLPRNYTGMASSRKIEHLAPNLEQLSMYNSMLLTCFQKVSPIVYSLSSLSHFEHLEVRGRFEHIVSLDPSIVTGALLDGMAYSRSWRHVTCSIIPVSMFVTNGYLSSDHLEPMRWHVVQDNKHVSTFRPRLCISYWRSWVPGMSTHQIVWELVT
jgi:hypothetical protein